MIGVARAGRGCRQLAGAHLGQCDQVFDVFHRQRRMRQQQQRKIHAARNDGEVAQGVVRQFAVNVRVDGQRSGGCAGDGVAVGGRGHQCLQADDAVGAGAVVDHHLLADALSELLPDDAAHEIHAAARWKGHDHADGFVGVGLCTCNAR